MKTKATKNQLKKLLGFTHDWQLAEYFGVTAGAVSQWREGFIPEGTLTKKALEDVKLLTFLIRRPRGQDVAA